MQYLRKLTVSPGQLLIALSLCIASAYGATPFSNAMPPVAGIWGSSLGIYSLSVAQREQLERKLQSITGWPTLHWTADNQLIVYSPKVIVMGSGTARTVLSRILSSGKKFLIENHARSPLVNFGQLDGGTSYHDQIGGTKCEIYTVRIDFYDFERVEASPEVRESFDPGFTLLHELLHGMGLKDATVTRELGECESVLNRIREELNLPLRDQYFGDLLKISIRIKLLRVRFKERIVSLEDQTRRWKNKYLFFVLDASRSMNNDFPSS